MDTTKADELLATARLAQTAFWEALQELEDALGVKADACRDLAEVTVDDLAEEYSECGHPASEHFYEGDEIGGCGHIDEPCPCRKWAPRAVEESHA
ncbi:MAG: hypothetical protein ACLGXA_07970 [Acidobacteriota bacterium]